MLSPCLNEFLITWHLTDCEIRSLSRDFFSRKFKDARVYTTWDNIYLLERNWKFRLASSFLSNPDVLSPQKSERFGFFYIKILELFSNWLQAAFYTYSLLALLSLFHLLRPLYVYLSLSSHLTSPSPCYEQERIETSDASSENLNTPTCLAFFTFYTRNVISIIPRINDVKKYIDNSRLQKNE